jgi:hypothetical protein
MAARSGGGGVADGAPVADGGAGLSPGPTLVGTAAGAPDAPATWAGTGLGGEAETTETLDPRQFARNHSRSDGLQVGVVSIKSQRESPGWGDRGGDGVREVGVLRRSVGRGASTAPSTEDSGSSTSCACTSCWDCGWGGSPPPPRSTVMSAAAPNRPAMVQPPRTTPRSHQLDSSFRLLTLGVWGVRRRPQSALPLGRSRPSTVGERN